LAFFKFFVHHGLWLCNPWASEPDDRPSASRAIPCCLRRRSNPHPRIRTARSPELRAVSLFQPAPAPDPMPNDTLRDSSARHDAEETSGDLSRPEAPMQRRREREAPVRASKATAKLFVLDTNVLMHDPTSLFRFAENDLFLPTLTLEELAEHKKG